MNRRLIIANTLSAIFVFVAIFNLQSCSKENDEIIDPNLVCTGVSNMNYYPLKEGMSRIYSDNYRVDIKTDYIKHSSQYYGYTVTNRNKLSSNIYHGYLRIDGNGDIYSYTGSQAINEADSFPEQLLLPKDLFVGRTWYADWKQILPDSVESVTDTVYTAHCTYYNCAKIFKYRFYCRKWEWYARGVGPVKIVYDCPPPDPGLGPGIGPKIPFIELAEFYQN